MATCLTRRAVAATGQLVRQASSVAVDEHPMNAAPFLQGDVLMAAGDTGGHEDPDPRVPPTCHGVAATIWWNMPLELIPHGVIIRPAVPGEHEAASPTGEEHDDEAPGYVIIGTSQGDVIAGSPKRDNIYAGNGDDVVCADPPQADEGEDHDGGSPGHGGGGPDKVWGGNGNDRIFGGGGPDSIYAGNDQDVVYGGGGPDAIFGDNGDDTLSGGPGPDVIRGGTANDVIHGDESGDFLYGDSGDDRLFGDGGFDILDGGKGTNLLDAGDQSHDDDHDGGITRLRLPAPVDIREARGRHEHADAPVTNGG